MTARIAALYRYPVKGLSAEPLIEAELATAGHFPGDRLFAIENGPSGFDPAAPEHQPKTKFLVLARQAALARLKTHYDEATGELAIAADGAEAVRADLATAEGRTAIETFFKTFLAKELAGDPKVLTAPIGFRFMDSRSGFASIINLATVRALEKVTGMELDPIRFRANIYIDGLPAFAEFDWVDKAVSVGATLLHGIKRTERCAATTVNPKTAIRDVMIPAVLMRTYGHADCGIYVSVSAGGRIAIGDAVAAH
ncbi:MOSC domain-containing protein [Phreatobacter stygius]|uniref:MOSC domain-containing protein n=1 Tax=Phreatobacter stygius TaxID=1940610 RepID=A0A4D7B3W5_9HYPH|nr:MOSC N-terminal beta barrel domain-containing protein [Phreatobacter stygius]QCI64336.1 MOSC domain-containing protein [Phreatobacter stygius]